jgi:hypothetical protein
MNSFAKKGPMYISSKSGNVKTLIIIDNTNSAEIEKTALLGQICNQYLQNSEFNNIPVFIYCVHSCSDKTKESIYLSFDRGQTKFRLVDKNKVNKSTLLKENGLVIRVITPNINPRKILELMEFGLKNIETIKKNQKETTHNYWTWKSIDSVILNSILSFNFTSRIDSVLNDQYEICTNQSNIKYHWENQRFIFYSKKTSKPILEIPNICQIVNIDTTATLIYDTDNSFYYIDLKQDHIYSKQRIEKETGCDENTAIIDSSFVYLASKDDIISQKVTFYNPNNSLIVHDTIPTLSILNQLYNSLQEDYIEEIKIKIIKH